MAYLQDPDLMFLGELSSNDLNILHNVLLYNRDGKKHITSELHKKTNYKKYFPKHSKYWMELVEELQYFGGDTLLNKIRGHGVAYKEILSDVCDFLKINHTTCTSIEEKEELLLFEIMQQALSKSSLEQRREIFNYVNLHLDHSRRIANTICLKLEDKLKKDKILINTLGELFSTIITPNTSKEIKKLPRTHSIINEQF